LAATGTLSDAGLPSQGSLSAAFALFPAAATEMHHLKEMLSTAHGDEVASHLVALCQLLARGEAPAPVASHLAGARLHALPKKQGGVRPIAVGETLRHLVSKLLCQAVREDAVNHFWPLQPNKSAMKPFKFFDVDQGPIGLGQVPDLFK